MTLTKPGLSSFPQEDWQVSEWHLTLQRWISLQQMNRRKASQAVLLYILLANRYLRGSRALYMSNSLYMCNRN